MEPEYTTKERRTRRVIATLGDAKTKITCSLDVAAKKFPKAQYLGMGSFEEACELVKAGRAKYLLVPAAYPNIRHFLMDEGLMLVKAFKKPIPELVYGNMVDDPLAPVETIYHHKAVESLLPKLAVFGTGTRFVPVSSNEVAFEKMVQHGERAGCVSNQLVFDYYGQRTLVTLRSRRDMAWLLFVARSPNEGASK